MSRPECEKFRQNRSDQAGQQDTMCHRATYRHVALQTERLHGPILPQSHWAQRIHCAHCNEDGLKTQDPRLNKPLGLESSFDLHKHGLSPQKVIQLPG